MAPDRQAIVRAHACRCWRAHPATLLRPGCMLSSLATTSCQAGVRVRAWCCLPWHIACEHAHSSSCSLCAARQKEEGGRPAFLKCHCGVHSRLAVLLHSLVLQHSVSRGEHGVKSIHPDSVQAASHSLSLPNNRRRRHGAPLAGSTRQPGV